MKSLRKIFNQKKTFFCIEANTNTQFQFIMFAIVGLSNTVISYLIYVLSLALFRKLSVFDKYDYYIAQMLMFILSVAWSFYWNNRFVFKRADGEERNIIKALGKTYLTYSFTGLLLNNALFYLWIDTLGISEFIAPIMNLCINVPINFFLNKFWTFRTKPHATRQICNLGIITAVIILLCDIYMITVKLHYGLFFDEPFLIAQAECFSRNIDFFKDSWSAFQFAGVIVAPLSYVYRLFIGSNEGIIYFFRIIWLIMQNVLAYATYTVLKKAELPYGDNKKAEVPKSVAACAAVSLYFYFAYFYSVNYKTLAFWGCLFIVLLLVDSYRKQTVFKIITLGVVLSLSTLSYESMAIMLLPILFCINYISKLNQKKSAKYCAVVICTCLVCAGIFLGYAVFQIGIKDFLKYFPMFMEYEGFEQNVFMKIGKHAAYYIIAFIVNSAVIAIYEKWLKERISRTKFIFTYITICIVVIMFAKPLTITISRVHYIMCIIYTLSIVFIIKYVGKEQRKYYAYLYIVPTGFYILSIAVATYQGIAVSSMGCIPTIIPLFLLSSKSQLNLKGVLSIITSMMIAVGLIVVPCVYTTNLTIFHYTEEITEGPARGTRPLDTYVNQDVREWQEMVDKYIVNTDKPLMLGNEYYSVGYLYSDVSEYGTYSPGYVFLDSDRLVKFWSRNTDRQPTVAIIKTKDLPCNIAEFLSDYPIGIFLNEYFSTWNFDGDFVIAR